MGQAPATNQISLRTVPRNFPGRSGTREDQVYLVSPETAAASALTGTITDPRDLDMDYPEVQEPDRLKTNGDLLVPPLVPELSAEVELRKGPNIVSLPDFASPPETFELPVLLKVGDDVSTDEIMPAGARILPYRSNIPQISRFCFEAVDETYPQRAEEVHEQGGHIIVGGNNYGQGSSREHAALAPRYLGLRLVLAKSFARIHWQNLINFGVLPLTFCEAEDYERIQTGDVLHLKDLRQHLAAGQAITIEMNSGATNLRAHHHLSARQTDVLLAGGLIHWMKDRI
jgi:aconitate hydratase